MGYCILGRSCQVDNDFVPDDLGGNCDRLSEAFNPKATFVCCKQNPALFEEDDEFEAIIQEVNISHPTAAVSVAGESFYLFTNNLLVNLLRRSPPCFVAKMIFLF